MQTGRLNIESEILRLVGRAFRGIRSFAENETVNLLWLSASIILVIEVLRGIGVWQPAFLEDGIPEITLFLLSIFVLGVASQLGLLNKNIRRLTESTSHQAKTIERLQEIGITELWPKGLDSVSKWRAFKKSAKAVDLVTISAYSWTYNEIELLGDLLVKEGCEMRLILATPNSPFVALREQREGKNRTGAITSEIENTVKLYEDIIEKAGGKLRGKIEIRFCDADITCRVEIINNSVIQWTPFIVPARSSQSPTFELETAPNSSASKLLIEYFETLWKESSSSIALKYPAP